MPHRGYTGQSIGVQEGSSVCTINKLKKKGFLLFIPFYNSYYLCVSTEVRLCNSQLNKHCGFCMLKILLLMVYVIKNIILLVQEVHWKSS